MIDPVQLFVLCWTGLVFVIGFLLGAWVFGREPQRSGWQAPQRPVEPQKTLLERQLDEIFEEYGL